MIMKGKIVFSGIQPSGDLHIGNYIGAVRQWAAGQDEGLNIFCVVDMHAITVPQDPKSLAQKTKEMSAIILAAGVDPKKSLLFVQSHNPDHANLGWVLNCYLSMGQMNRMTQYKEKSQGKESVSVGVFDYPALMAADILLYDTTEVPIGEDQKQHVELTRDVAERFNSKYGSTFVLPEPKIPKMGGRVMSLVDPTKKMSKSDANPNGAVMLLESPESARKKIMAAVTDSGSEIKYDWNNKPGISNLLEILSQLSNTPISDLETQFSGQNYGQFKTAVADEVEKFLVDFQKKYHEIVDSGKLDEILSNGAKKSYEISHPKLLEVYKKVGFL
ncbi:MAG: Tryptophan-tRNA ligase [Candidatus Amesbacteria bacterium GW2011_GWA2_42_12]|uniref:Tryptophan--tRNA ligase n=1 Tax=Candidatus Amesbacteria bacterium GW2011_GWA2_42_12 TaxID=1618356 RepID=A0A0G0Y8A7_9BACT|nr:MAG: Tryptophan-tRNA ligase [Candidatus Amesbacteria bacterium GW2011_GWA2_42_12]